MLSLQANRLCHSQTNNYGKTDPADSSYSSFLRATSLPQTKLRRYHGQPVTSHASSGIQIITTFLDELKAIINSINITFKVRPK